MPQDWYTVPPAMGGRSLPLWRRLQVEWIWRRHGDAGMARLRTRCMRRLGRKAQRAGDALEQMARALEQATVNTTEYSRQEQEWRRRHGT